MRVSIRTGCLLDLVVLVAVGGWLLHSSGRTPPPAVVALVFALVFSAALLGVPLVVATREEVDDPRKKGS